jgi:hypothetical protein
MTNVKIKGFSKLFILKLPNQIQRIRNFHKMFTCFTNNSEKQSKMSYYILYVKVLYAQVDVNL